MLLPIPVTNPPIKAYQNKSENKRKLFNSVSFKTNSAG